MASRFLKIEKLYFSDTKTALQISAGQRSITANLWLLTGHIYHAMIIVTGDISKKSFFLIFRNSRTLMFFKAGVIRNFAIFTGKRVLESIFNNVAGLTGLYFNLVQKETSTRVFYCQNSEIFTNSFFV